MRKSSFKIGLFLSIIALLAIGMSGNNLIQVNANESNLSVVAKVSGTVNDVHSS